MADDDRVQPAAGQRPRLISVVLPVRNGGPLLDEQLDALAAQDYAGAWEVVVADNGSSDGTQARVLDRIPGFPVRLRLVDASAQVGVGMARNEGSRVADGDFHVYCDADDVADRSWLHGMAEAARTAAVVAGWLDYDRLNSSPVREWRPTMDRTSPPLSCGWRPYAIGASLGIWAEVLHELGGFRAEFARFGDDVELCWRAQLHGHQVRVAADAVMHYRFRPGLRAMARQFFAYGRAEPHLYAAFREHGLPRRRLGQVVVGWAWLVRHLPDLRHRVERGVWVREAAFAAGRIRGAVERRTLYL